MEQKESKKFFKTIQVSPENEDCEHVIVYRDRGFVKGKKEPIDGVSIIAWHFNENGCYLQQEFVEVPYWMIDDYIRDFSGVTAQNFVDRFEY